MNAWTVHMSLEFVVLRMLKIVGSWKDEEKENCYWGSKKSFNWFLKQEKSSGYKKKISKKKEKKERERKRKK